MPSQINYVINTRLLFNSMSLKVSAVANGYIRIMKVNLVDEMDILNA